MQTISQMQKVIFIAALLIILFLLFSKKSEGADVVLKSAKKTGPDQSESKTQYGWTKEIGTYSNLTTGETKPITEYFQAQINDDVIYALAVIYGTPSLYMEAVNHSNVQPLYRRIYDYALKMLAEGKIKKQ